MISIKPLIKHLTPKPAQFHGVWFRQVGGAAEFAAIRPNSLPLPACWIVRAADNVKHAGERAEDVKLAFDAVIAIENVRALAPGDADDELLKYRRAVYELLLGWEIEPDVKPINFDGGQVIEYTAGDLFWRDRYSFGALITNYLPDPEPVFSGITHMEAKADDHYL